MKKPALGEAPAFSCEAEEKKRRNEKKYSAREFNFLPC